MDNRDYWQTFGILLPKDTVFDKTSMTLKMELYNEDADISEQYIFQAKFKVCPCCEGKGSYVNPNIDRNGLTYEDFNAYDCGEEFENGYFSGRYDVVCSLCEGEKVIPGVCKDSNTVEDLNDFEDWVTLEMEDRHERISELKYGY